MTDTQAPAAMPFDPELWLPVTFADRAGDSMQPQDLASTMASDASALRAALRRRPPMTRNEATVIARDTVRTLNCLHGVLDAVREQFEDHGHDSA